MNSAIRLASAAALVLVVVGAAFVLRPASSVGPAGQTPSTAPTQPRTGTPTATPTVTPAVSSEPLDLTTTFTSDRYRYSIRLDPSWSVKLATTTWAGPDNSAPAVDEIHVTGTVTTINVASQALGASDTYESWLAAFHANTTAGVPPGCDGGAPSTWPPVPIGDQIGAWEQLCNAAEALVLVQRRVYVFTWGNSTFGGPRLTADQFKEVLRTVAFAP